MIEPCDPLACPDCAPWLALRPDDQAERVEPAVPTPNLDPQMVMALRVAILFLVLLAGALLFGCGL